MTGRTIIDKIWESHAIVRAGKPDLLYVDMHFVHEVSSPQAFDGLRAAGRTVRRPDLTFAVEDHNVPTRQLSVVEPVARAQVEALRRNCAEFSIGLRAHGSEGQGIVHVVGPESGATQPGMTVVCGDSHTSTHGALGALAWGIGTSEVEHVLATQTLPQVRPRSMAVRISNRLPGGATAKDLALHLISRVGTNAGQGYIVEYQGAAVDELSMEERMTLCNLSTEWGAKASVIAPDEKTFRYLEGREFAPKGPERGRAVARWSELRSDEDGVYDAVVHLDAADVEPWVTWGTNPAQGVALGGVVPDPDQFEDDLERAGARRALVYMGLEPGTAMRDIMIDTVFIGSCTNARIEDLRLAAAILAGRTLAADTRLIVVPGSMQVKAQAEEEGLDDIFVSAGGEWRFSGCSMCLGLNDDRAEPGVRTASTSNRNYEGRQGVGVRTHLVSPAVAAATAIRGHLASAADI